MVSGKIGGQLEMLPRQGQKVQGPPLIQQPQSQPILSVKGLLL